MAKGDHLGEFEQLVLLAVLQLREKAYGLTIRKEIENRTGRFVSIGATYATLDRLERKGYVKSWLADPTASRGRRPKRYFKAQAPGVTALNESHSAITKMRRGLEPALGGAR